MLRIILRSVEAWPEKCKSFSHSTSLRSTDHKGSEYAVTGQRELRGGDCGPTDASRVGNLRTNCRHARGASKAGAGSRRGPFHTDYRGKRHWQRHHRPPAALVFALGQRTVRESQLSGDPRNVAGERIVRLRERRVYGGSWNQAGTRGDGAPGNAVPRRDLRARSHTAGQAVATVT